MPDSWRDGARGLTIAVALCLSGGVLVACGSGDGSAADEAAADREDVKAVYVKMRMALAAKDGAMACRLMTAATQREFAAIGEAAGGTCEAGFTQLLERADEVPPVPTLVGIELEGDKAVVTARTPTSERPQRAPFVRERGEWRVSNWFRD